MRSLIRLSLLLFVFALGVFSTACEAADAVLIQLEKTNERLSGIVIELDVSSAPAHAANFKKLEAERDDIETNKIFENAFEWRFEFPEVLNDEGDFIGFNVVIGNPPYAISSTNKN